MYCATTAREATTNSTAAMIIPSRGKCLLMERSNIIKEDYSKVIALLRENYLRQWLRLAKDRWVWIKGKDDCKMLQAEYKKRLGGRLSDKSIWKFYIGSSINDMEAFHSKPENGPVSHMLDIFKEWATPIAKMSKLALGYSFARQALSRGYESRFPWFELEALKKKVDYDIAFLKECGCVTGPNHDDDNLLIRFYGGIEEDGYAGDANTEQNLQHWKDQYRMNLRVMPGSWEKIFPDLEFWGYDGTDLERSLYAYHGCFF